MARRIPNLYYSSYWKALCANSLDVLKKCCHGWKAKGPCVGCRYLSSYDYDNGMKMHYACNPPFNEYRYAETKLRLYANCPLKKEDKMEPKTTITFRELLDLRAENRALMTWLQEFNADSVITLDVLYKYMDEKVVPICWYAWLEMHNWPRPVEEPKFPGFMEVELKPGLKEGQFELMIPGMESGLIAHITLAENIGYHDGAKRNEDISLKWGAAILHFLVESANHALGDFIGTEHHKRVKANALKKANLVEG